MTTVSESTARELIELEAAVMLRGRWQVAALVSTPARWQPWRATLTSPDVDLAGYTVSATVEMNGAVWLSEAHRRRTPAEQAQVGARLVIAVLAALAGFGWFLTVLPMLIGTLLASNGSWRLPELCAAVSPIGLGALLWARSDHFGVWTFADPAERRVQASDAPLRTAC